MLYKTIIIVYLIFIFIVLFYPRHGSILESIDSDNNINIYVISLRTKDRLENIEKQQKQITIPIEIFDATMGDRLDIDELISTGKVDQSYRNGDKTKKREIGCYMSHLLLYNKIKETNKMGGGYTIVLEDDFAVKTDNLIEEVNSAIDKLKNMNEYFDMLYLGNLYKINGEKIIDNIYRHSNTEDLLCTHAYIINNNSIDKIINLMTKITQPIDLQLNMLSKNEKLKLLVLFPTLIDQGGASSIIHNNDIELYSNYSFIKH